MSTAEYIAEQNMLEELEFLRWFYRNCDFGPADSDVKEMYHEQFKAKTGKALPDGYEREVEE